MQYDLVFEGGGAKGMVFVGALQEFEARGHTYDRLLGTSAGAITATFLAAGYDAQEILSVLSEKRDGQPVMAGFLGTPPVKDIPDSVTRSLLRGIDLPLVPGFLEEKLDDLIIALLRKNPHLFSFIEQGGWYSAHNFVAWLEEKLGSGTYRGEPRRFSHMNLAQFHEATDRHLSLIAADTSGERILVLNHRTAPDCPLVWAVRMSMSVPLLWQEVEWKADWGAYRGEKIAGNHIVDGGLLSNFPLELFVSHEPQVTAVMGPKKDESGVLGLLIDESLLVEGRQGKPADDPDFRHSQLRIMQCVQRLINTALQAHDKMVMEAFSDLVVRLPVKGYGTIEFDMSDADREALIAAGRYTMQQYFEAQPMPDYGVGGELEKAYRLADKIALRILE